MDTLLTLTTQLLTQQLSVMWAYQCQGYVPHSHWEQEEDAEHLIRTQTKETRHILNRHNRHQTKHLNDCLSCNWNVWSRCTRSHVFLPANCLFVPCSLSFTLIPPQKPLPLSNQGIMSIFEITIRNSCDSQRGELPNLIKLLPLEDACKKCN